MTLHQELFEHMNQEHQLVLLEEETHNIESIVRHSFSDDLEVILQPGLFSKEAEHACTRMAIRYYLAGNPVQESIQMAYNDYKEFYGVHQQFTTEVRKWLWMKQLSDFWQKIVKFVKESLVIS